MSAQEAACMSAPASRALIEPACPTIVKGQRGFRLCPNLADCDRTCHHFTWDTARLMLEGLPGGRGITIAHETVDRRAIGPLASHLALRTRGGDRHRGDLSTSSRDHRVWPIARSSASATGLPAPAKGTRSRLHGNLGVDIPEVDCPQLGTLDGAVGYLVARCAPRSG